jgi:hypothetical protein
MARMTISRLRLLLIVLGCAVLGGSLLVWARTSRGGEDAGLWVGTGPANTPGTETAEVWRASASCERPFFIKAVLRSKAALKSYYNAVPQDVRASRERAIYSDAMAPSAGYERVSDPPRSSHAAARHDAAAMEYDAALHAQYAEWYATVSKLEIQENQWERRLRNVADQRVILSEATRRGFKAYGGGDAAQPAAKSDFEHYVLFLLGLTGFPADEEDAITASCVTVAPVKIFAGAGTGAIRSIWRWPVDHVAVLSFGFELVLIGLLLVPISIWIGTGDLRMATRHAGGEAWQLLALARDVLRQIGDAARRAVAIAHAMARHIGREARRLPPLARKLQRQIFGAVRWLIAFVRSLPRRKFVLQIAAWWRAIFGATHRSVLTAMDLAAARVCSGADARAGMRFGELQWDQATDAAPSLVADEGRDGGMPAEPQDSDAIFPQEPAPARARSESGLAADHDEIFAALSANLFGLWSSARADATD